MIDPQPFPTDQAPPATPAPFGGMTPQDIAWHQSYESGTEIFKGHVGQGVETMLKEFRAMGYVTKGDIRLQKLVASIARYLMESQQ